MRISDLIAVAAFLIAMIGAVVAHRQKNRLGGAAKADTSVKITYGTDKKSKGKTQGEPGFKGTFTVNKGTVCLESAHFMIRRQSQAEYIEFHAFLAEFDPPREKPVIEGGHMIHVKPANAARLKESAEGGEGVFVEFKGVSGEIFRSPELTISQQH